MTSKGATGGDVLAFDSNKYKREFNKERYANYKIRIPKSKKSEIDHLMAITGKSANRIFVEAVEKLHHVDLTIVESELEQSE